MTLRCVLETSRNGKIAVKGKINGNHSLLTWRISATFILLWNEKTFFDGIDFEISPIDDNNAKLIRKSCKLGNIVRRSNIKATSDILYRTALFYTDSIRVWKTIILLYILRSSPSMIRFLDSEHSERFVGFTATCGISIFFSRKLFL